MADEKNSVLNEHQLKTRRLVWEIAITHHATPASVTATTDLPGVCKLAMEGLLTPVTDVEAISGLTNYTAPDASDGIIDVMLTAAALGSVKKVMSVKVNQRASTGLGSAPTVQILGSAGGLTTAGNIVFEVDTATDLTTTDATFVCEVEYLLAE